MSFLKRKSYTCERCNKTSVEWEHVECAECEKTETAKNERIKQEAALHIEKTIGADRLSSILGAIRYVIFIAAGAHPTDGGGFRGDPWADKQLTKMGERAQWFCKNGDYFENDKIKLRISQDNGPQTIKIPHPIGEDGWLEVFNYSQPHLKCFRPGKWEQLLFDLQREMEYRFNNRMAIYKKQEEERFLPVPV